MPAWRSFVRARAASATFVAFVVFLSWAVPAGDALAAQGDRLQISTQPSLYPTFNGAVSDYVVRCQPGTPVQVSVDAPPGTKVSVDNGPARQHSFTAQVNLRSGQEFMITVNPPGGGKTNYYVRCLPSDFPQWTTERLATPQAEWYITAPTFRFGTFLPDGHYVVVFDTNGVPVWWYDTGSARPADTKLLPNGDIAWTDLQARAEEHKLDGTLVASPTVARTAFGVIWDLHDIQLLPNGDYLLLGGYPRQADLSPFGGPSNATIFNNVVQEIAPNGNLVWQWDTNDHIPLREVPSHWWPLILSGGTSSSYDTFHINSAEWKNGNVHISFRHLDAIYEVSRSTGKILWKLGGIPRPESLTPVGDPYASTSIFGGQHDARILPDGTVTVHDNGTGFARPPRAVRYRLDLTGRTATLIEQVTDPDVGGSGCCGSARKLPTGDWLVDWGLNPYVTELTPTGNRVFRITFSNMFAYRAFPVMPGQLSRSALRAGMDEQYPR